jgi:hypothetical protein
MNTQDALERLASIHQRGLTPGQAVEEAVSIYLELGDEIKAIDVARAAAKQVIADVVIETGKDRFDTDAGLAYIANPGLRIGYDAKGIEALIENRPDLAEVLAPYRSETMVAGGLVVRAKGGTK